MWIGSEVIGGSIVYCRGEYCCVLKVVRQDEGSIEEGGSL